MTDDLIERLRAKRHVYPAQGGGDTTGRCYTTDDGFRLVNPDGPAAAARIATQQEAIDELVDELNKLSDWASLMQSGERSDWGAGADKAYASMEAHLNAIIDRHGERT